MKSEIREFDVVLRREKSLKSRKTFEEKFLRRKTDSTVSGSTISHVVNDDSSEKCLKHDEENIETA